MIGAIVLLPLYVAIRWTGKALPLPLKISYKYRVARSRLTHFEFEYCAGAIACRCWRQGEQ